MVQKLTDTYTLQNGSEILCIGYGTFLVDDATTEQTVVDAVNAGYRHIETASYYGNETGIGAAV